MALWAARWKTVGQRELASVQFSSVAQLCLTLCDPTDCSTPGLLRPSNHSRDSNCPVKTYYKFILYPGPKMLKWASLVAQTVKNLPAMQETWVQSLGWEDPLEEGMAIYSSILTWRIPMDQRSLAGCSLWGSQRVGCNWATKHTRTA